MAKQERQLEGDNEARRHKAKQARDAGKKPSEVGATLGASKQRKKAPSGATHQEKLELKHEGKQDGKVGEEARPGSRERDPNDRAKRD